MGLVKVDVNKAGRQFERISFSDVDCIKALIKNRSVIDEYQDIESNNHFDYAGITKAVTQELIISYLDLDALIKQANLNDEHKELIFLLMQGNTEKDVAEIQGKEVQYINSMLDTVSNKIKKVNDYNWKHNYIYATVLPVHWDFKVCSKCKESKPMTNEFFSPDSSKKDGYKSICKTCR